MTCLLVTPHFPPSVLAGVHRVRHMAKYLTEAGWQPIVLTVSPEHYGEAADERSLALVPRDIELVSVGAVPETLTRPIGVGDVSLRGLVPLWRAASRLVRERNVRCVFITGAPYYAMLMAPLLKRRFGVPVVLDFQDPWVSAWGARQAKFSKAGASHLLATALEPRALKGAAFVTSVSEVQNAEFLERNPSWEASRMAAIPIGGDPEDFALAREVPSEAVDAHLADDMINVSYVGAVWPEVMPVLEAFLRGYSLFRERSPSIAGRVRLNFIGTGSPSGDATDQVTPLAERLGLGGAVVEHPRRLPFLDAIAVMARSDTLLALGSLEPHYTSSKIYPLLMSGVPYVAAYHRAGSSYDILRRAGGGIVCGIDSVANIDELVSDVAEAFECVVETDTEMLASDPAAYEAFTARSIALRYARIFDGLVGAS